MSARVRTEYDHLGAGVRIAISPREHERLVWSQFPTARRDETPTDLSEDEWLRLDEDVARALYESLADYFGHAGHDTRALRRDYDAERKRVDQFISHLTREARP